MIQDENMNLSGEKKSDSRQDQSPPAKNTDFKQEFPPPEEKQNSGESASQADRYRKLYDTPIKRAVWYLIGSLLIIYLFASIFPFLLDYYVEGSKENVFSYVYNLSLSGFTYYDYEILLIFLACLVLYALTASPGWSAGILSLLGIILAYASKIKYENRMELINYTDLKLTEAAGTFAEYLKIRPSLSLFYLILFSILVTGAGTVIHILIRKDLKSLKKPLWIIRIILVVITVSGLCLYQANFIRKEHAKGIDQTMEYLTENADRYLIYHFLASDHVAYAPSEASDSYNSLLAQVKETGLPIKSMEDFDLSSAPTVIVIMNESWWDLDHIPEDKISYSEDPMGPLRELEEKCSIGTVGVNIYGGGTICSEEEYKLGINNRYFSSSLTIYDTLTERKVPSIAEYFNRLGYRTTAIHPYYGEFYKRTELYKNEGYENILFFEDMDYTEAYDRYISDNALVDQIIHEYEKGRFGKEGSSEKTESRPDYIYALSIASHVTSLEYELPLIEDFDYPIKVTLAEGVEVQNEEDLNHYVNGIYYSNLAIKKLIEYFEKQDEPVMIIMYGDHCPSFNVNDLRALGLEAGGEGENHVDKMKVNPGLMGDPVADEVLEALYTTPCLEWDNFSNKEFTCHNDNICYLDYKLIEQVGLPDTPMTLFQKLLRTELQTDIRAFRADSEGNKIQTLSSEQYDLTQRFLMVQYDALYGDQVCGDLWQPIED